MPTCNFLKQSYQWQRNVALIGARRRNRGPTVQSGPDGAIGARSGPDGAIGGRSSRGATPATHIIAQRRFSLACGLQLVISVLLSVPPNLDPMAFQTTGARHTASLQGKPRNLAQHFWNPGGTLWSLVERVWSRCRTLWNPVKPQGPQPSQNLVEPWKPQRRNPARTVLEPSWNLTLQNLVEIWWKSGGALMESYLKPARTAHKTLVKPWWKLGGTLVEPWGPWWKSGGILVEPSWNLPRTFSSKRLPFQKLRRGDGHSSSTWSDGRRGGRDLVPDPVSSFSSSASSFEASCDWKASLDFGKYFFFFSTAWPFSMESYSTSEVVDDEVSTLRSVFSTLITVFLTGFGMGRLFFFVLPSPAGAEELAVVGRFIRAPSLDQSHKSLLLETRHSLQLSRPTDLLFTSIQHDVYARVWTKAQTSPKRPDRGRGSSPVFGFKGPTDLHLSHPRMTELSQSRVVQSPSGWQPPRGSPCTAAEWWPSCSWYGHIPNDATSGQKLNSKGGQLLHRLLDATSAPLHSPTRASSKPLLFEHKKIPPSPCPSPVWKSPLQSATQESLLRPSRKGRHRPQGSRTPRNCWNPCGTLVEPLWNPCGTLVEPYTPDPRGTLPNHPDHPALVEPWWNPGGTLVENPGGTLVDPLWNCCGTFLKPARTTPQPLQNVMEPWWKPRRWWNPGGTGGTLVERGTLVEPWWNLGGTLPQGRPEPPRSLSGLRPQSFQLLGKKQLKKTSRRATPLTRIERIRRYPFGKEWRRTQWAPMAIPRQWKANSKDTT